MSWTIGFVNRAAEDEIEALPADMIASFLRIGNLIKARGLLDVHEPYVKHLEDKLWEMRLKGEDGIARSIYVAASGKRVVVLRTFIKKTDATPRREIALAYKRMKEIAP